jgi:hypothetical protein
VLYELLSGRIPYEGPDTRTTNGYVLKTTAKSPRDYDASIPEPLAEVVMQALHPSTEVRFKDGAEAEAALKRAWDECLTNEMVLLPSLTGPELAHDRVTSAMHHTVALRSQARVGKAQAQAPSAHAPSVAASSERRAVSSSRPPHAIGDDDPTRILSRVPEAGNLEPMGTGDGADTARHAAQDWAGHSYPKTVDEPRPFGQGRDIEHDRTLPDVGRVDISRDLLGQHERRRPGPTTAPPRGDEPGRQQPGRQAARAPAMPSSSPARIGLWIMVLLLAVAAGAGAAYWVIGRL